MVNGGHFCILPTGVDNFRIDNLVIDTNRDGIDIDCCKNVRIANTHRQLAQRRRHRAEEFLCAGRGSRHRERHHRQLHGQRLRPRHATSTARSRPAPTAAPAGSSSAPSPTAGSRTSPSPTCVFEYCRGLALETVDGGQLQDVTISNITMRNVQMPIFLRLGARMRGPAGIPVGTLRRVSISDVIAHNADPRYPSCIAGIPGHDIEDIRISNVRHHMVGGLTPGDAVANPPELVERLPGADDVRHAAGVRVLHPARHRRRPGQRAGHVREPGHPARVRRART